MAAATRGINLTRSTSSSIVADLAMLRVAADVMDEATATAAADWLEAAMEDPTRLRTLTYRRAYDPQQWIAEHLEGIFQAIPREGAERTVSAIERYGADFGVLAARDWGRVLTAIPRWAWTAEQAARLATLSSGIHEEELIAAIAFVGQAFDPAARNALLELIRADQIWPLNYIDDLGTLAPDSVDALRSICVARVDNDRAAERDGSLARGSDRPLDGLVALTLTHPTDGAWDVVQRAIADPQMPAWYKQSAIARVASGCECIDNSRRATLATAVRAAGQVPPSERWFGGDVNLAGEVACARVVLDEAADEGSSEIARLAGGEIPHRRWAARLARDTGDVASLGILATDRSPLVRAESAYGLAQAAMDDVDDPRVISTLRRVIADRGRATGIAVAQVIADATDAAALAEVRNLLADHPSAEVRRLVRRGNDADDKDDDG